MIDEMIDMTKPEAPEYEDLKAVKALGTEKIDRSVFRFRFERHTAPKEGTPWIWLCIMAEQPDKEVTTLLKKLAAGRQGKSYG